METANIGQMSVGAVGIGKDTIRESGAVSGEGLTTAEILRLTHRYSVTGTVRSTYVLNGST